MTNPTADLRARLEEQLRQLEARQGQIRKNLRRAPSRDWQEQAQEAENDEVLEALDESGAERIDALRRALARFDEGSYGACTVCGEDIAEKRLEALPWTTRCVRCAS